MGSHISSSGRISEEVCSHMQKARLAFTGSKHLFWGRDTRSLVKGRVHTTEVFLLLLYDLEAWSLRVGMRGMLMGEHCCVHIIGGM